MSNLIEHAQNELELAGLFGEDDFYGGRTGNAVMELIKAFDKQGHSGMSAPMVISIFKELALFNPINPITGEDDEWSEVGDDRFQNKRLSAVFKNGKNERPHYIDAIVWREPNGACFTGTVDGIRSSQYIKLPFLPKTFYVDIDEKRNIIGKVELEKAFEYYDRQD